MILAIYGTTGELIKLAPVLARLQARGHPFLTATTAQQVEQIPTFLEAFSLPAPDVWLGNGADGRDLSTNRDIPPWLGTVARRFRGARATLRGQLGDRPLVLVHGDTMTTLLGALMGRILGAQVAHIESGLRSFDIFHPFPEELNRRATAKLAHILYAPGPWAASNLRRGDVVDTGSNTIRDSLAMVSPDEPSVIPVPDGDFGIVSLHRFELLRDRELFSETLAALARRAETTPMFHVNHAVTAAAIKAFGLEGVFSERFQSIPRATFFEFVALMRQSSFLVTDSGGSQEETFYLDIPCLVHRKTTERREGLGENVVVSKYEPAVLDDFLRDPTRFRRRTALPEGSPADAIVDDLERRELI